MKHGLLVVMSSLMACSFQQLAARGEDPPTLTSIVGDSTTQPGRIASGLIMTGTHLATTRAVRLLDAAGTLLGELVIGSASANTVTAVIPVATAALATPGSTWTLELETASGTVRQAVQVLKGEDGLDGAVGATGAIGAVGATGATGPTGAAATIFHPTCPAGVTTWTGTDFACKPVGVPNAGLVISGSGVDVRACPLENDVLAWNAGALQWECRGGGTKSFILNTWEFRGTGPTIALTYDTQTTSGAPNQKFYGGVHIPVGARIKSVACRVQEWPAANTMRVLVYGQGLTDGSVTNPCDSTAISGNNGASQTDIGDNDCGDFVVVANTAYYVQVETTASSLQLWRGCNVTFQP